MILAMTAFENAGHGQKQSISRCPIVEKAVQLCYQMLLLKHYACEQL